ncbi:MAG: hypothetical protein H0X30_14295 [Anaerolineae bacterium]|nr:hypothetical protein [Anaerolineae bacterium]
MSAEGSATAAEMTQMQRIARLLPPLYNRDVPLLTLLLILSGDKWSIGDIRRSPE